MKKLATFIIINILVFNSHVFASSQKYFDEALSFYNEGKSGEYLKQLGFETIHENEDFFSTQKRGDIIVSNIPFSCKVKVFQRLKELDMPFIIIVPISTISKQFYMEYFADKCKIIIPNKRIHFEKNGDESKRCWFDTIFICYKIDTLEKQITYLK